MTAGVAPGSHFLVGPSAFGSHQQQQRRRAGKRPGSGDPDQECTRYLADNRRAALQWSLEGELSAFERSAASSGP